MNAHRTRGSALLATLVISFILAIMALQLTLLATSQNRLNRAIGHEQTAQAEMERYAEETYGHYAALMRHDGTINDHDLPGRGDRLIEATGSTPNCERRYRADPTRIEIGIITVHMLERCEDHNPDRDLTLTYRLSPTADAIVSLLPAEPEPAVQTARANTSGGGIHLTYIPEQDGYLRVYVETPTANDPQPYTLLVANQAVARGVPRSRIFTDPYPANGVRHVKFFHSDTPFASDGPLRTSCGTGTCGANSVSRLAYGYNAGSKSVTSTELLTPPTP